MDRFADSRRPRSAGAADPPHRAALENSWDDAAFQYPRDRQLCPNFIERRELSSAIASHFGVTSDYHGALCQRVLLWGLAGSGKRQLATQFALTQVTAAGRVVLWVEGDSMETFVRDYRNIHQILVGSPVPKNLNLVNVLSKVKRLLEERHLDWFLVLLDAHSSIEDPTSNSFGLSLASYLPDRGQILMSTSCVIIDLNSQLPHSDVISCGMDLNKTALIRVEALTESEARAFCKSKIVGPLGGAFDKIHLHRGFGLRAIRLALSCSNMLFLELNPRHYDSFYIQTYKQVAGEASAHEPSRTMSRAFSVSLNISWDLVNDLDRSAVRLLVYISVVAALEIPIELLERLPPFKEAAENNLSRAIGLLSSLSLVLVRIPETSNGTISMHYLVHRFLYSKIQQKYGEEYRECISDWISVLVDYLPIDDATTRPSKFWDILPHICQVIRNGSKFHIQSQAFVSLLHSVGLFLVNDGLFYSVADILICQAISMALWFRRRYMQRSEDPVILLQETRAKALWHLNKPRIAERELQDALSMLESSPIEKAEKDKIRVRLRDALSDVLLTLNKFSAAETLLKSQLETQSGEYDIEKARRHYLMARCLCFQNEVLVATKHSHMAMSYWKTNQDKWSKPEFVEWANQHAQLLMTMQKPKGAIQFFTHILERYIEWYDAGNANIWRTVYCMIDCYSALKEVSDAESLVVRMLCKISVDELHNTSLTYCLMLLNDLATLLRSIGRVVEAEAIYRHNIAVAGERTVPNLGGEQSYEYYADRLHFILSLAEQGKMWECDLYRERFKRQFNDELDSSVRDCLLSAEYGWRLYNRAFEGLRDGYPIKWNISSTRTSDKVFLKHLVRRYGNLEQRVKERQDPLMDLDLTGIRSARTSKLLHLLDRDLVYLSFTDRDGNGDRWNPQGQAVIGEYFKFCECRRFRKRSHSLNPVDLIDKRILVQKDNSHISKPRKLKQMSINDWFRKSAAGPAVDRLPFNLDSAARSEVGLFPSAARDISPSEPEGPGEATKKKRRWRYKTGRLDDSTTNRWLLRSWDGGCWSEGDIVRVNDETGCLTWVSAPFETGDHKDENYVIDNALSLPSISISFTQPPESTSEFDHQTLDRVSETQKKITEFFPTDYSPAESHVRPELGRSSSTPPSRYHGGRGR